MTKLVIRLHKKTLTATLDSDKLVDEFYIMLNDATKTVKFGNLMFDKSEFEYAYTKETKF